jgi:hypothetical protein
MTSWIEPPPPQKGMGCFAKGCLILVIFFVLLLLAFIGGGFLAMRYLRTEYFPKTGIELPTATPAEQEEQAVRARWQTFDTHARAHEPARIELSADDVNALIASEPQLRGKAHVSIEDNVARLQISIPLDTVWWLHGHYMNGECTVQSSVSGHPGDVRLTSVIVNGRPVADEALQWQHGPWSVRRYINDWATDKNLKTFEIRDGKVILESKGE